MQGLKAKQLSPSCAPVAAPRPTVVAAHGKRGCLVAASSRRRAVTCFAKSGGAGVIDNPTSTTPTYEKGTENIYKKPPIYNVLLHNDNYNRREYVVKALLKVVQGLKVDDAVNIMQEAHNAGLALVICAPQEDAERYCEGLRLNGLTSTIEPGK